MSPLLAAPPLRVMLLIDADNVSADVVEQAVDKVQADHGAIHVRRAYCTAESALANLRLFKAHSIRPIVNLSTGKNSTDIALAVDAVDLVIAERPSVVVIVSSDSDFAPLVIKLREKGCRVEGIGQLGKTGEDSKGVYDAFTDLAHRKSARAAAEPPSRRRTDGAASGPTSGSARARRASAPRPDRPADAAPPSAASIAPSASAAPTAPTATRAPPASPVAEARRRHAPAAPHVDLDAVEAPAVDASAPVDPPPAKPRRGRARNTVGVGPSTAPPADARAALTAPAQPAAAAAPKRAAAPATSAAPTPSRMPDDLRRILAVLPELVRGGKLELGVAAERLRSESLLAKTASSTRLFRKYPDWFALTPEGQPNKVQYLGYAPG